MENKDQAAPSVITLEPVSVTSAPTELGMPSLVDNIQEGESNNDSEDDEETVDNSSKAIQQNPKNEKHIQMYCFTISPQKLKLLKTTMIFGLLVVMLLILCWVWRVGPFA